MHVDFWMPVEKIKTTYDPIYPFNNQHWDATIEYLKNDPIEFNKVKLLMEYLEKDGKFQEPIELESEQRPEMIDDEDEEYHIVDKNPRLKVLNGTHRFVAALILGVENINVRVYYDHEYEDYPDTYMETHLTFASSKNFDEDTYDALFSALISIPVSDKFWMTSSVMSNRSPENKDIVSLNIIWDTYPADYDEAFIENLESHIRKHLDMYGFEKPSELKTIVTRDEDE